MKLAILSILLGLVLAAGAQPARVILIRHGEKPAEDWNPNLSEKGQDRAERIVKWLSEGKVLGTNGAPVALYAAAPTNKGRNKRCVQTLEPTARHLGLTLRVSRERDDFARLAQDLLRDKSLRGKNVVVCWVHDFLPDFAAALGITPPPAKWKDGDYDGAYVITFPEGKARLEREKQKLKKKK